MAQEGSEEQQSYHLLGKFGVCVCAWEGGREGGGMCVCVCVFVCVCVCLCVCVCVCTLLFSSLVFFTLTIFFFQCTLFFLFYASHAFISPLTILLFQ